MGELFLFGENLQARYGIAGDAQHFSVIVNKIRTTITNCAQFARADSGESEWVEHDNHVFLTVEIGEGNTLTELIGQGELWGAIADA